MSALVSGTLGFLAAIIPLAIGFTIGRLWRTKAPVAPVRPVCACEHTLGAHVDGNCQAAVRREHYASTGERNGFEWVPCACRRYTGPEHIADWWVPKVLTEEGR